MSRHPGQLSMFDPVYLGQDMRGKRVDVTLAYRNMLIAGEPGAGKSVALNNIVAHAALAADADVMLIDGKLVELLPWRDAAQVFVGNSITEANRALEAAQAELDKRINWLAANKLRKIDPGSVRGGLRFLLVAIDELAYFTSTVGTKDQQERFITLVRDLVARGRAVGIIVVGCTQRPSAAIIPTSLRDICGFRLAFRCTTDSSSDIVLGDGWSREGYSAREILPEQLGVGYLLAEGGIPRKLKTAYLSDADVEALARWAVALDQEVES